MSARTLFAVLALLHNFKLYALFGAVESQQLLGCEHIGILLIVGLLQFQQVDFHIDMVVGHLQCLSSA